LINKKSKQPDNTELYIWKNFSDGVRKLLKIKNMKQNDLIKQSCLTRTTVNRICRNSNDNGYKYKPPKHTVFMAICIGLKLNPDEAKKLYYAAYPEMAYLENFINNRISIAEANEILYDNELSILGNIPE